MMLGGTVKTSGAALDALIEQITVDAYGEDEQLWAFREALEEHVSPPCAGFVLGFPVTILGFEYEGNRRLGLTAKCRDDKGTRHVLAVSSLQLPEGAKGARYLQAYRKWLGVPPIAVASVSDTRLNPGETAELVIVSGARKSARCLTFKTNQPITLRLSASMFAVPGEIAIVRVGKHWMHGGQPYLAGEIEGTRLDVESLGLQPLALASRGIWKPREQEWSEKISNLDPVYRAIIARGPRPEYEMEQILPGLDEDDDFYDPIIEAVDLKEAGDTQRSRALLMELCQSDLRCLDAHAHLGNLVFDRSPEKAIRHYEVGYRIGAMSLGKKFKGLLPWSCIDNRPFLRCMSGFGLRLWRLRRFEEAFEVFERMLWMNPRDNQGVRFMIDDVRARRKWMPDRY